MADTLDITAGAGTTIATDDVGGVHYQEIKLVNGTKDSSTPVAVDIGVKANALRVAPANDITDATYIGDIKFGEAEPNSAAIKTALELIDNAVDGAYLNVNTNIAGVDFVGGAGAVAAGVQRVTLASDDPAVALLTTIDADTGAIKTAVELLDNAVDGNYINVNLNIAGTDVTGGAGAVGATTQRVTLASDDPAVVDLAAIEVLLGTIDADTGAIKTAVEKMDDWDAVHDSAASTDGPQQMAAYDSTKPTAVANGDAVRILADAFGRLLPGVEPKRAKAIYDSADATAEGQTVIAAPGAGLKLYITSMIISVDIEGWIKLQDEDSNALTGKMWLKAGGGVSHTFPEDTPLVLDVANKALEVIAEAVGNVSVTLTYYPAP
jgi:hypothetical protein